MQDGSLLEPASQSSSTLQARRALVTGLYSAVITGCFCNAFDLHRLLLQSTYTDCGLPCRPRRAAACRRMSGTTSQMASASTATRCRTNST
eukprot:6568656-Prymnesium_polylepis.2